MSLKLLDLAVEEASEGLPEDHFLRQQENIDAAKNMIMGVTEGIDIEKTWLYTIVNNRQSGVLPLSSLSVWWIPRCPVLSQHPGLCMQCHLLFEITTPYTQLGQFSREDRISRVQELFRLHDQLSTGHE